MTLERKLTVLSQCGLELAPPFTADDLIASLGRGAFERDGFDAALVGLGMTEERPPWRNHCVNVWHFDTECIEDTGSYAEIAERMQSLTQGSLRLENIRDHVDLEADEAWLVFDHAGTTIRIDCAVDDDWVDMSVFAHFTELLGRADPSKVFVMYDLRGQDCIIACVTKPQFEQLKEHSVAFEYL